MSSNRSVCLQKKLFCFWFLLMILWDKLFLISLQLRKQKRLKQLPFQLATLSLGHVHRNSNHTLALGEKIDNQPVLAILQTTQHYSLCLCKHIHMQRYSNSLGEQNKNAPFCTQNDSTFLIKKPYITILNTPSRMHGARPANNFASIWSPLKRGGRKAGILA